MSTERNETQVLEGASLQNFFDSGTVPDTQTTEPDKKETIEDFFTEPEKPKVEETHAEVKEEKPVVSAKTDFYTDLVKELINDGDWEDLLIEIEEGQEPVSISQFEEITPELYKQLKDTQKAHKDEQFNQDYISVKGLDDTTRKMIELKKAGGDLNELIKAEVQIVHPLKNLDLKNEKVQENLVRQKYNYQGIDEDIIDLKIKKLKDNLQLDLEANKIIDEVNLNFSNQVAQQAKEQEEFNRQIEEDQKAFRKQMTETFRSLDLKKDSLVKTLVDTASKQDENGLSEADKLFFSAKEDPKLFAEVVFLLTNPEAYNEYKGVKIKNNAAIKTAQTIFKITPKAASAPQAAESKSSKDPIGDKLFNQ